MPDIQIIQFNKTTKSQGTDHPWNQKYLQNPKKKPLALYKQEKKICKISQKYEEHCRASSPKTNLIMSTATGEHILPPTGKVTPSSSTVKRDTRSPPIVYDHCQTMYCLVKFNISTIHCQICEDKVKVRKDTNY